MDNVALINAFTALINNLKDEVAKSVMCELNVQSNQKQEPLFYNLKQVVKLTGLTFNGLKGRIKKGEIKSTKDGNTPLISKKEFDRLIDKLNRNER